MENSKNNLFKFVYLFIYIFVSLWQRTRMLREFIGLPKCRFYPSCSDYFLSSIKNKGLVKGIFYSLLRFIKCNPLFEGGIDEIETKVGANC